MRATIVHNGKEIPEALCIVDTSNNTVSLTTMTEPCMKLDLENLYVSVRILGDLKPLEDD